VHGRRLEQAVPEDSEGDHLVKNAAELVAAAHATWSAAIMQSRLPHETALQVLRKLLSASCHRARRRRVHVDSLYRTTSMKLTVDSVNEITPDLQLHTRKSRVVTGHGAETDGRRRRAPKVFCSLTKLRG